MNRILNAALLLGTLCLTSCATIEPSPDHVYRKPGSQHVELGAVAWSPDGTLAAVANYDTIWVLDPDTLGTVSMFQGDADEDQARYRYGAGNTLLFLDHERIASTGLHGNITILNVHQEDRFRSLPVTTLFSEPVALGFSPTTGALAVGGQNGNVVLLQPDGFGGYSKQLLPPFNGSVRDLVFSLDGKYLAGAGLYPEIRIWDTQSLMNFAQLPMANVVTELALFPGGKKLLAAGVDTDIWYFMTGEQAATIENPGFGGQRFALGVGTALMFAASIAAATYGVAITPGMPSFEADMDNCGRVAALSADGRLLADRHPGVATETIRIIEMDTTELVTTLNPKGGATCDMAFSPDGKWLLLATEEVARLYDTDHWRARDFILRAAEPVIEPQ